MPTLVHLADERDMSSILNGGIKIGKKKPGIYCMPVSFDFYITHQWLRELKRGGARTFVGVYFKVAANEMVYAGKYNEQHNHMTLGEAINNIKKQKDPLGYELIIARKIESKEITRIKHLPQIVGWRYMPDSHNELPCSCDFCLKGTIKGNRTKQRIQSKGD